MLMLSSQDEPDISIKVLYLSIGQLEAAHQRIYKQARPVKHLAVWINNPYRPSMTIIKNTIKIGKHPHQSSR